MYSPNALPLMKSHADNSIQQKAAPIRLTGSGRLVDTFNASAD
jgi:hypothetical protein